MPHYSIHPSVIFKMKNIFIALLFTIVFTLSMSAKPQSRDTAAVKDLPTSTTTGPLTTAKYQDSRSNDNEEFDTMERIMNECNETFRIELAYLESLNDSGSFTDETDRTPKCYIRCMLEKMEILSEDDGTLNPARAAVMFAGERNGKTMEDIADMTALCADRKETCRCEKAYQFMRCLMSMEIARYEESQ